MTLKNKNVLITGARGGIGRALVEAFSFAGANVFANLRKPDDDFNNFAKEISSKTSAEIVPIYFDMQDVQNMKNAIKSTFFDSKVSVDILVNNAGVAHGGFFQMTPVSKIKEVFAKLGRGAFVETADLLSNNQKTGNGDDIHFCRESQHILGRRYFEAFKNL